jgi:hypothetical protein
MIYWSPSLKEQGMVWRRDGLNGGKCDEGNGDFIDGDIECESRETV